MITLSDLVARLAAIKERTAATKRKLEEKKATSTSTSTSTSTHTEQHKKPRVDTTEEEEEDLLLVDWRTRKI